MKCPKCAYLGFDTGERCRNCGYDFSLIKEPSQDAIGELSLRTGSAAASASDSNPLAIDPSLAFEPAVPPPSFRGDPSLPLFGGSAAGHDEPLIKVPSTPRAPLSVRRTPERPRLRALPRTPVAPAPEPEFDFAPVPPPPAPVPRPATPARERQPVVAAPALSGAGSRIVAAAIDHLILLVIDLVVLYLTLRIASLTMDDWRALPMLPMGTFLGLLKLAYFTAFTYVGGQTIGKMAVGIRVVGEDYRALDAPHAIHRALAGAVSFLTLGAGFIPALFGADHRALHDRLAHTRVVVVPGA